MNEWESKKKTTLGGFNKREFVCSTLWVARKM